MLEPWYDVGAPYVTNFATKLFSIQLFGTIRRVKSRPCEFPFCLRLSKALRTLSTKEISFVLSSLVLFTQAFSLFYTLFVYFFVYHSNNYRHLWFSRQCFCDFPLNLGNFAGFLSFNSVLFKVEQKQAVGWLGFSNVFIDELLCLTFTQILHFI